MDNNIGKFIKIQREKNNISQTKLAELLFVDRTLISKWENDKLTPGIKEIIDMAKIFNISVEEFLSKTEYTKDNKEEIENNFNDYLIKQDNRLKSLKKNVLTLSIISVAFLLVFFIYYFYQTFNKTRVYIVSGMSTKYEFHNGIFILTRGKSYLKIGNIDSNIERVKIFYEIDNNEKIIYEGDPNDIKIDLTGYDSSVNLHNINKIINDIKMIIYTKDGKSELVKLVFKEDFANKYLVYSDKAENMEYDNKNNSLNIPDKIRNNFECNEINCKKKENDFKLTYDITSKVLYLDNDNYLISFNTSNKVFSYTDFSNNSFTVVNNNYDLNNFNSEKAKNIYNQYMNLILKYIG